MKEELEDAAQFADDEDLKRFAQEANVLFSRVLSTLPDNLSDWREKSLTVEEKSVISK